ncbi:response regulator transcription factor [Aquibacillus salsiterrae]|uniref:Response regulator transcription factor n=1 Tax=Aquibacillus salsiterrae TaxID=2950439 RepID=A0A9X4ADT7_9BACI|nr:response regulator transcription factor [Aquibacillus salsiterrae]MDC3415927.1 response regulator transcription factor [Aquibacillus salsiterrae]
MVYRVFLVDDDRYVRKGLRSLIDWNSCGFEVCAEADNGEDALYYIKNENPDLVITDIRMPVLDGLALIKHTVELTDSSSNFIIISGYSDFSYAQKAVRYGVHDFILKPIDKDELESTLKKVSYKIKKERERNESNEHMIRNSILNDLLTGKMEEAIQKENLEKLRLQQGRLLCYMFFELNKPVSISSFREVVDGVISSNKHSFYIREHSRNGIGLLVTFDPDTNFIGSNGIAEVLQTRLRKEFDTAVTVFVGKTIQDHEELRQSYETAVMALQYKFIEPEENPIIFENIAEKAINYIELDQSFYDAFMEEIEEFNETSIVDTVERMMREFQEKSFSMSAVETSINRVVHEVVTKIKSLDGDESQVTTLPAMLHWEEHPLTHKQIKQLLSDFVLESAELIFELNKNNAKGNIVRIKKYIDTNFRENLTLKGIAKEFYMNPVYMGQLFKNTFGIYFKDYFLQVRMNEAKKMLRQTDMKIYEVAESVGFTNPDYFVIQFEKLVGMSPSKYRNKVKEK